MPHRLKNRGQAATRTSILIDHEPCFFTAAINLVGDEAVLTLYASSIVRWGDELLDEVRRVVDFNSAEYVSKQEIEDDGMFGGRAVEVTFRIPTKEESFGGGDRVSA